MTSGTKLAILVVLLLFVGAGIYVAFVAPPPAGEKDLNGGVTPRGDAGSGGAPSAPPVREAGRDATRPAGASPGAQRSTPTQPASPRAGDGSTPGQRPETPRSTIGDRVSQPPASARAAAPDAPAPIPAPIADPLAKPASDPSVQPPAAPTASPSAPAPGAPTGGQPTIVTPRPAPAGGGEPRPAAGDPQSPTPAGSPRPQTPPTAPAPATERTHLVASGDTMTLLAERYFGDRNAWQAIAKANPLVDPAAMKVGTRLVIPGSAVASAPATPPAGTTPGRGASGTPAVHEVAAGETLYSIARRHYGTPGMWELIYAANRDRIGADPAALKVGMRLTLPPRPAARAAAGGSSNDS